MSRDDQIHALAWGQQSILGTIERMGRRAEYFTVRRVVAMPRGLGAPVIRAAVATLVREHEGLRTLVVRSGAGIGQRVLDASADVEEHVVGADVLDHADAVGLGLASRPFDHVVEPPMRCAAVTSGSGEAALAIAVSHFAVDAYALALLVRRIRELAERPDSVAPEAWQPRRQAQHEATLAARTRHAIDHWVRVMERADATSRTAPAAPERADRFVEWRVTSASAGDAGRLIAERTGTSLASVVLAVWCVALGVLDGRAAAAVTVISGNRHREHERRYIGPLAQDSPLYVDWSESVAFDELVRQVHRAALQAYAAGRYDPVALAAALGAADGAVHPPRRILTFFNDARGERTSPRHDTDDPVPRRSGAWPYLDLARFLTLQERGGICRLRLCVDTEQVEEKQVPALLTALRDAMVAAADECTVAGLHAMVEDALSQVVG